MENGYGKPHPYVDSGTNQTSGLATKLTEYRSDNKRSLVVTKQLSIGYYMNHLGLLCWTPIPSGEFVPLHRLHGSRGSDVYILLYVDIMFGSGDGGLINEMVGDEEVDT